MPVITQLPEFVNNKNIMVNWAETNDAVSGLKTLRLYYSTDQNFTTYETIDMNTTSNRYTLVLPENNRYYIKIMVWDNAGNNISSNTVNTFVDSIPPETYLILTGDIYMSTYITPVGLEFYPASDSSGVNTTYYSLNNDPFSIYTQQMLLLTENRTYLLKYYSVDNAGNTEETHTKIFKINISLAQPDIDVNEPGNISVKGNCTITWNMSSPINEPLYVTIIVLQAENGQTFVIAENLLNITSYNIDTNTIPNGRFYIKIIIKDSRGRVVNSTTLTSININNPYIKQQEIWLGNQTLSDIINVTEGSINIIAGVTNRNFNTTLFTTDVYIGGVYKGRAQKTLTCMEKQNMTLPILLTPGENWIQLKLYDGNILIETITKSVIVTTSSDDTTPPDDTTTPPVQKEEKKVFSLDFWLIGLIVTILVSALLISGKKIMKKHNEEKNKFSNMVQQKNSKSETKKTEKEGEENKEEKGSKKEGWE